MELCKVQIGRSGESGMSRDRQLRLLITPAIKDEYLEGTRL
jgi:hypothetical protein